MKTTLRAVLVLLILPMLASPALAQVDLSGTWNLQASGVLPPQQEMPTLGAQGDRGVMIQPCVFEGGGNLVQNGSQITGQANLTLITGPTDCPPEMMADVMGSLDGLGFGGMLDGGQMFGGLNFVGSISQDGQSIQGSYTVKDGGPFQNVTNGSWTAARATAFVIPTLGTWAVTFLAALLALTSLLFLRRTWA